MAVSSSTNRSMPSIYPFPSGLLHWQTLRYPDVTEVNLNDSAMSTGAKQADFIKWKHFSRYWSFCAGIHRSPVNSPHKGQWRGALIFSSHLNKRLNKQSWGWWFQTPSHPLWRHCNECIKTANREECANGYGVLRVFFYASKVFPISKIHGICYVFSG